MMDQFEVLVGNYGIKPQGKSAPMAAVKSGIKTHNSKPANPWNSSSGSSSRNKSIIDDHDDPFHFNSGTGVQKHNNGGFGDFDFGFSSKPNNDKFGNGASSGGSGLKIDVESMFMDMNLGPKPSNSNDYDDLFSGFPGKNTSQVDNAEDLLSSTPKKVNSVDDFLGNFGGIGSRSTGSISTMGSESKRNKFDHEDELIPGFGEAPATNHSVNQNPKTSKKETQEASFIDIESSSGNEGQYGKKEDDNEWNFQAAAPANAEVDLDTFFTTPNGNSGTKMSAATTDVDIDDIFNVPNPSATRVSERPIPVRKADVDIDSLFGAPKVKTGAEVPRSNSKHEATPDLFFGTSSHSTDNLSSSSAGYDFDLMFGGSTVSGAFKEIEGEDKERRRARYDVHLKTQARMARALADMNSREHQAQQEQEERHRIAETKDSEMKLWAASKEGNLRALLSSLHQVLWPECEWKALFLTDLITSSQVKIAYKRAALCVHPDKVQQRGATVQQKYVAEKVFDLLKEAWNKFNQEELR